MSTLTLAVGRPTLADRLVRRSLATDLVLIAAGAALTAIAAQVAVPLWPVPITGQTLAVLIVGSSLGAVRGMLSMVLYAALGIVGLPVFSDASHGVGVLLGATGGYIVGFIRPRTHRMAHPALLGPPGARRLRVLPRRDRHHVRRWPSVARGRRPLHARADSRVRPLPVHHRRRHQGRTRSGVHPPGVVRGEPRGRAARAKDTGGRMRKRPRRCLRGLFRVSYIEKPRARIRSRPSSVIRSGPHGGIHTQLRRQSSTMPSSDWRSALRGHRSAGRPPSSASCR